MCLRQLDKDTIVTDRCAFIPEANLYSFGVLTSSMHMTWMSHTCGRLKSDYNYSINIVYNNFPWPEAVGELRRQKIVEAAQTILDARAEFPGSSLADLYDPRTMPPTLVKAHSTLDRAVDVAYGYRTTSENDSSNRIIFLFDLHKNYISKKI